MALQVSTPSKDNPNLTIKIQGRFDYSLHKEFRDSYNVNDAAANTYQVDLSETEYMDSSALGMLLLLKEHADEKKASVTLLSPTPEVKKVLEIANFGKFFKIK